MLVFSKNCFKCGANIIISITYFIKKGSYNIFCAGNKSEDRKQKTQKIINNKIILCHIIQKQDGVFAHI